METPSKVSSLTDPGLLRDIQDILQSVQTETRHLAAVVASLNERITLLTEPKIPSEVTNELPQALGETYLPPSSVHKLPSHDDDLGISPPIEKIPGVDGFGHARIQHQSPSGRNSNSGLTSKSRIILTTYPGQSGIHPVAINWGHADPIQRGPVLVSRNQSTIRRRNGTRSGISCHEEP